MLITIDVMDNLSRLDYILLIAASAQRLVPQHHLPDLAPGGTISSRRSRSPPIIYLLGRLFLVSLTVPALSD